MIYAFRLLMFWIWTSLICQAFVAAFVQQNHLTSSNGLSNRHALCLQNGPHDEVENFTSINNRRSLLLHTAAVATSAALSTSPALAEDQPPSFVQEYDDFTESANGGWRYRVVQPGNGGVKAQKGDRVVFDWWVVCCAIS